LHRSFQDLRLRRPSGGGGELPQGRLQPVVQHGHAHVVQGLRRRHDRGLPHRDPPPVRLHLVDKSGLTEPAATAQGRQRRRRGGGCSRPGRGRFGVVRCIQEGQRRRRRI
ncbi:unnamed protein product, partial [Ectocarpus sp. 12 AP-2014]